MKKETKYRNANNSFWQMVWQSVKLQATAIHDHVFCVIMAATSCSQILNESVAYRRKYRPFILPLAGSSQFAQCRSFHLYFPQPCIPDKSFTSHSVATSQAFRNPYIIYSRFSGETTSFYLPLFHQSKSSLFTINSVCVSLIELIHYFGSKEFYYG